MPHPIRHLYGAQGLVHHRGHVIGLHARIISIDGIRLADQMLDLLDPKRTVQGGGWTIHAIQVLHPLRDLSDSLTAARTLLEKASRKVNKRKDLRELPQDVVDAAGVVLVFDFRPIAACTFRRHQHTPPPHPTLQQAALALANEIKILGQDLAKYADDDPSIATRLRDARDAIRHLISRRVTIKIPNDPPPHPDGDGDGDGDHSNAKGDDDGDGDGDHSNAKGDGDHSKGDGDGDHFKAKGDGDQSKAKGDGDHSKAKGDGDHSTAKGDAKLKGVAPNTSSSSSSPSSSSPSSSSTGDNEPAPVNATAVLSASARRRRRRRRN